MRLARVYRTTKAFLAACCVLLGGACTTATFPDKPGGGSSRATAQNRSVPEAGVTQLAGARPAAWLGCEQWDGEEPAPGGTRALLGAYAMRIDHFDWARLDGPDGVLPELNLDFAAYATEQHHHTFLAEIAEGERGLDLVLHPCELRLHYEAAQMTADGEVVDPSAMPVRRLRLHFGPDCTWGAEAIEPVRWGYEEDADACAAGDPLSLIAAGSNGSQEACECPEAHPAFIVSQRDCRITDPDGDGRPGATIVFDFNGIRLEHYVAELKRSTLVFGASGPDGTLTAREHQDTEFAHLGCRPGPETIACGTEESQVVLEPIDPAQPSVAEGCRIVSDKFGELPAFPETCRPPAVEGSR